MFYLLYIFYWILPAVKLKTPVNGTNLLYCAAKRPKLICIILREGTRRKVRGSRRLPLSWSNQTLIMREMRATAHSHWNCVFAWLPASSFSETHSYDFCLLSFGPKFCDINTRSSVSLHTRGLSRVRFSPVAQRTVVGSYMRFEQSLGIKTVRMTSHYSIIKAHNNEDPKSPAITINEMRPSAR